MPSFFANNTLEAESDANPGLAANLDYAVGEMPSFFANNTLEAESDANATALQICAARQQVVAGMNYFLSFSTNCSDPDLIRTNVTIWRMLDGTMNVTDFTGGLS
eukprot:CAMPEP_0197499178 /NCGR_PEP_ID=MMETSP1311-20131121/60887_1 /TAXON_ID=464262 /ORGANISM="Genus nov. species nov., Strain RCC856" /LENGTH=104 /DNA_ID=CAMNT_0043044921 /DNA_START=312 /DNA_END=627 /DNA_ORIENTATION=-